MNIKFIAKSTERLIEDNAPMILSSVAVVGTVATGYLAARGGMRAAAKIAYNDFFLDPNDPHNKRTTMDTVKLTYIEFLPAAGAGVVTITAVICAHRISAGRIAAMAAAYSLSEGKMRDYKEKVQEKFGMTSEKEIQQEAEADSVKRTKVPSTIVLGSDDVMCFDSYSGRYFKSSMEALRGVANDINFQVIHDNFAELSEFWDKIGLEQTAYSGEFGWTKDCILELQFSTMMSSDDRPCMLVSYDVMPTRRWNHLD